MNANTKPQSNDDVVGFVGGSSAYCSCTPASPPPRRLVLILIATWYKRVVIAWLLVPLVCAAAGAADKASPPPDPEMLEFLGTFETADGKGIDPFLLEKSPQQPAASNKNGERKPVPRKAAQEKTSLHWRELQDE